MRVGGWVGGYIQFDDVVVADKGGVWNTDLIETLELQNLITQAAQTMYAHTHALTLTHIHTCPCFVGLFFLSFFNTPYCPSVCLIGLNSIIIILVVIIIVITVFFIIATIVILIISLCGTHCADVDGSRRCPQVLGGEPQGESWCTCPR